MMEPLGNTYRRSHMYDYIQKALDAGCPWKIIGNGGYEATLIGYFFGTDHSLIPVYRYPGGGAAQPDLFDGLENGYFKIVQQLPNEA